MNTFMAPSPSGVRQSAIVRRLRIRVLRFGLLATASIAALAVSAATWADVPGRVGRIAYLQGDVQSYTETDPEWKVAYPNEPITSRNSIFVGDAGRAEISVGSTTLAMDAGSQVDIQQLDDSTFNANVVRGRVSITVRRLDPNDVYNVAAPGAEFALLRPGRYRIDALDGASGVTVFAGQASVEGDGGPVTVPAGSALRVFANAQDPNGPPQLVSAAPVPVPLDDWVVAREERFRESVAQRYVSPNMTGYEDLDANGRWASEPDVGPIWYPTTYVRADWAPYRYGRWAYVAPWGYTWIDDAPWGFAPFHYGRWLQVGDRWGWCPGAYVARPAYAPALVGFYGGSNFTATFSVGVGPAVGWYPLAPWQRFTPDYAHNTTYVNQVNNITVVNVPQRFGREEDWNRVHGGTIVPQNAFASQRSISRVAIAAPRDLVEHAAAVNGGELPRPVAVSGAVRRGPDVPGGIVRPEFRSPRTFAGNPVPRDERAVPGGSRPQPNFGGIPTPQRDAERRPTAPNEPRFPEAGRPAANAEAARPAQATPAANFGDRGQERSVGRESEPRGPSAPAFSRDARPIQQATPRVNGDVPNPVAPAVDRFGPRQQAMERGNGEALERARQAQQNAGPQVERQTQQNSERQSQQNAERQAREFRAPQAPQPAAAAVAPQAPQPARAQFERPQRAERAPAAPVAPVVPAPAPAAAPANQPRPQASHGERPGATPDDRSGPLGRDR